MQQSSDIELVDATNVLKALKVGRDVVVKYNASLPKVRVGGDIDIYSLNKGALLASLVEISFAEQIEATITERNPGHSHFDVQKSGTLLFRLDIYSAFPQYKRFSVSAHIFAFLVGRGRQMDSPNASIPRLPNEDEAFVRYLEYLEFYWTGPEKTHHLDWITASLTPLEMESLFERAHNSVHVLFPQKPAAEINVISLSSRGAARVLRFFAPLVPNRIKNFLKRRLF